MPSPRLFPSCPDLQTDIQKSPFSTNQANEAKLTAETLAISYTIARRTEFEESPESSGPCAVNLKAISAHTTDATNDIATRLSTIAEAAKGSSAIVYIGHDPGTTWLLNHFLTRNQPWWHKYTKFPVPALAHTELIACKADHANFEDPKQRYCAIWSISPSDKEAEQEILTKVKSKMETSKTFAGLLTALTTFAANNLPDTDRQFALLGLGFFGISIALYLVTMFWYDRILMPKRFWASKQPKPNDSLLVANRLVRPPSSSTWVLYQNMRTVWSRVFLPATGFALAGLLFYVYAKAGLRGKSQRLQFVGGCASALVATAIIGFIGRPHLGAQD